MARPCPPLSIPARSPLLGRHYQTGSPVALHHAHGTITRIESLANPASDLPWIAPSLVDLQVNGFAGIDFQSDNLSTSQLEQAVHSLLEAGCGRFLLTLITDEESRLLERFRNLNACRQQSTLLQTTIAGWHLEGPYLSSQPGYHGAHPPQLTRDPRPEFITTLRQAIPNDPLLITLAPERPGALETIRHAVRLGCQVSLGHTNADTAILANAVAAGARGFTHLGNACPRYLDRHDNILWRVLDQLRLPAPTPTDPPFCASVIPDGIHVSPALLRTLYAAARPSRLFWVSDAMSAAGKGPGPATLGPLQLEVGTDGIVRQPGASNFAGSALRPIDGVFRAATMLGIPWSESWEAFACGPARWMGLPYGLHAGQPAHCCLLDFNAPTPLPAHAPAPPAPPLPTPSQLGAVRLLVGAGQQLYQAVEDS